MKKLKLKYYLTLFFASLGMLVSVYLAYEYNRVSGVKTVEEISDDSITGEEEKEKKSEKKEETDFLFGCPLGGDKDGKSSCANVRDSKYAQLFGQPMPVYGVLYYAFIVFYVISILYFPKIQKKYLKEFFSYNILFLGIFYGIFLSISYGLYFLLGGKDSNLDLKFLENMYLHFSFAVISGLSYFLLKSLKFFEIEKIKNVFKIVYPDYIAITIGFLFSIYLTGIEAFVLKEYCTYCLIQAFCSVMMFFIYTLMKRKDAKKSPQN